MTGNIKKGKIHIKTQKEEAESAYKNILRSPSFLQNQRLQQIGFPALVVMFILIFAFQNCDKVEQHQHDDIFFARNTPGIVISPNPTPSVATSPSPSEIGDKAVFKISEKYKGNKSIAHILWQVRPAFQCHHNSHNLIEPLIAKGKEEVLQVNWNDIQENIVVEAVIQFEENGCLVYKKQKFDLGYDSGLCTTDIRITSYLNIMSMLSSSDPETEILKYGKYFAVNSSVDLTFFKKSEDTFNDVDFNKFQWSIQKAFLEDATEYADSTHTTAQITHTFSETGFYRISVTASEPSNPNNYAIPESLEISTSLMIGKCDENMALEIILGEESFGSSTPSGISKTTPIWNYVRPSDVDINNVQLAHLPDESGGYKEVYKYKRNSSTKFIDIDILNADKCFFDDQPNIETSEIYPDSLQVTIRENLEPLSSCGGKIFDMGTLDTDITQCTDAIFLVATPYLTPDPLDTSQMYTKNLTRTYYKHCPANDEYCYFGKLYTRPNNHKCSSHTN